MCGGLWTLIYDKDHWVATRNLCRTWSCGYCGKKRQKSLVGQAIRGQPNTFLTLTTNPARPGDKVTRARELIDAFKKLVKAIRKLRGNKDFEYLAIVEANAAGEPHLHVLCRSSWIDQRWISNFMAREISAPIVDIRRLTKTQRVAWYVAKYTAKRPHRFGKLKRYFRSKRWQVIQKRPLQLIAWVNPTRITGVTNVAQMAAEARAMGFVIVEADADYMKAERPPPQLKNGASAASAGTSLDP